MSREPIDVTAIIPVYNAEKTIDRCLEALTTQTWSNLEIITVNDGSTDSTPALLEEWALRDSRICVISKMNGGASSARNVGLDEAHGEYILFVDADDVVEKSLIETMLQAAKARHADIVEVAIQEKYLDGSVRISGTSQETELSGYQALNHMLSYAGDVRVVVWDKLYRRSLIGDYRFDKDIVFGEDALFNFQILMNCEKVFLSKYVGYIYDRTNSTVTSGAFNIRAMDNMTVTQKMYELLKNVKISESDKEAISSSLLYFTVMIIRQLFRAILLSGNSKSYRVELKQLRKYASSFSMTQLGSVLSFSKRVQWIMYLYFPWAYVLCHKMKLKTD